MTDGWFNAPHERDLRPFGSVWNHEDSFCCTGAGPARADPRVRPIGWLDLGTIAGARDPLVADGIVAVGSWRWIFVISLPLVVVRLWLIMKAVPKATPSGTHRRNDVVGALLCVLGLGASVFALIEQPRLGWSNPAVAGALTGGVALFAAFLLFESRARNPTLRSTCSRAGTRDRQRRDACAVRRPVTLFFFLVLDLQQIA